jgi:hypothetical protein
MDVEKEWIMAENRRTPKDVGSRSPASESAKEQRMSGTASGPQEGREAPRTEKQPPQTSGRRDPAHEHRGTVRKGYEASRDPERQGDGDPGPAQLRDSPGMQGIGGSGSRGRVRAEDAEERAQSGEPEGGHTAHGRQAEPGARDPQQPS